jgi:hypothetical protein
MADTMDSKSIVREGVRVQIPPRARLRAGSLAVAVAMGGAASACGGAAHSGGSPRTTVTAKPSSTPSSVPATPTTFGGIFGKASKQACLADFDTVRTASDEYRLLHGHPALSIGALIQDGDLRAAPSTNHGYVIGYQPTTGTVTAVGVCTVP